MKKIKQLNNGDVFLLPKGRYLLSDACYVFDTDESRVDLDFYAICCSQYKSWGELEQDVNINTLLNNSGVCQHEDGLISIYLPTLHGDCSLVTSGEIQEYIFCDAGNFSIIQCKEKVEPSYGQLAFELLENTYLQFNSLGDWSIGDNLIIVKA